MTATMVMTTTLSDGSQVTGTATVTDAQAAIFVGWAQATFAQQMDGKGNPIPRTPANLVKQWFTNEVVNGMSQANAWYQATQVAAPAPPISVTIT